MTISVAKNWKLNMLFTKKGPEGKFVETETVCPVLHSSMLQLQGLHVYVVGSNLLGSLSLCGMCGCSAKKNCDDQTILYSSSQQHKQIMWMFKIVQKNDTNFCLFPCYLFLFQGSACSLLRQASATPPGSAWNVSAQLLRPTRCDCWP